MLFTQIKYKFLYKIKNLRLNKSVKLQTATQIIPKLGTSFGYKILHSFN